MKKSTTIQYDWTCFNNFRVFFIPQTEDTGIEELSVKSEEWSEVNGKSIYDLQGKMVNGKLPWGVYIINNGKKIYVK